jgi:hypothetical protein
MFSRAELVGKNPIWLLRFSWIGRDWYFSTRTITPLTADGEALPHTGQLSDIRLDGAFDLLTDSPSSRSANFEVHLDVDVADLVAKGADLNSAEGELSLWIEGTTYEKREVMLVGDVLSPGYGASSEPINFAIEERIYDDRSSTLSASQIITSSNWPNLATSSEGQYYPLVFGTPGVYGGSTTKGSPAYLVNYQAGIGQMVIAGHRVSASTVTVVNANDATTASLSVSHEIDSSGNEVALVNIHGSAVTKSHTDKYFITWNGGSALEIGSGLSVTNAGQLLEYALERTTIGVDRGRLAVVKPSIEALNVSGYIDEPSSWYDWFLDNLAPLLPISLLRSEVGIYATRWRPDANRSSAVEDLYAGEGLFRSSSVSYVGEPINQIRINYALDVSSRSYLKNAIIGPRLIDVPSNYVESLAATTSETRYGLRIGDELESDLLYNETDALFVAKWRIQAFSFPRREITYDADPIYAWIAQGSIVTITDPDLSLYSVPCLWSTQWDGGRLSARLLILSNPNLDVGDSSG